MNQKAVLRSEMKQRLAAIDPAWAAQSSRQLCEHLAAYLERTKPHHVLAWLPFFPGEADLTHLIGAQLDQRALYLPCTSSGQLEFVRIDYDWPSRCSAGPYGILEPNQSCGEVLDLGKIAGRAAVLVPGLAFDRRGGRLGRGKGYYDRFLNRAEASQLKKIGVAWEMQLVGSVPLAPYDATVDMISNENGVIEIKQL